MDRTKPQPDFQLKSGIMYYLETPIKRCVTDRNRQFDA